MDSIQIKYELARAGFSQTKIADMTGTTVQAVNGVIMGRTISGKIRRAISEAIGVEVSRIWPEKQAECTMDCP